MTLAEITDFVLDWVKCLQLDVQSVLDASLPNKQQHKAASSLIKERFDTALFKIAEELDKRG